MISRPLLLTALAFAVAIPSMRAAAQTRVTTPRQAIEVVGGETIDLGRKRPGIHRRTIRIANTGGDTLRGLSLTSGCGCLAGALDRLEIAPGDTASATITVDVTSFLGESWGKSLTLFSTDPVRPQIPVFFKASFYHDIRITSLINTVVRDTCPKGLCPWRIELTNSGDSAFTIMRPTIEESKGVEVRFDMPAQVTLAPGEMLAIDATVTILGGVDIPMVRARIATTSSYDSEMWATYFYAPPR